MGSLNATFISKTGEWHSRATWHGVPVSELWHDLLRSWCGTGCPCYHGTVVPLQHRAPMPNIQCLFETSISFSQHKLSPILLFWFSAIRQTSILPYNSFQSCPFYQNQEISPESRTNNFISTIESKEVNLTISHLYFT